MDILHYMYSVKLLARLSKISLGHIVEDELGYFVFHRDNYISNNE